MKTNYLALLLLASALAGGSGQALALAKCGDYPEGTCMGGDRCNRSGLWIKDSTCSATISRQPGAGEQKEKARAGQAVGSETIFDRWGIHKTKASCESAGGGWINSEGKTSCQPRVDKAKKQ